MAHSTNGLRFRDGVGVDGQHDVGSGRNDGNIQRAGLAAVAQPQPDDRCRFDHLRSAAPFQVGCGETELSDKQIGSAVGGSVIGDEDLVGWIVLVEQGGQRRRQCGRLVVRGHDHRQRAARSVLRRGAGRGDSSYLPAGKDLQHRVIHQVRQAHRPRENATLAEGEQEQGNPHDDHAGVNEHADDRRRRWCEPGGGAGERRRERISQRFDVRQTMGGQGGFETGRPGQSSSMPAAWSRSASAFARSSALSRAPRYPFSTRVARVSMITRAPSWEVQSATS